MKKPKTTKHRKQRNKELANRKAKLAVYAAHMEANKTPLEADGLLPPARRAFQDT